MNETPASRHRFIIACLAAALFAAGNAGQYTSLDELEGTLLDIQNENLKRDTQALKENLTESEYANARLSDLSAELWRLSTEQAEAYRRQSASLDKSERRLRNWRLASLIEGGLLAALLAVIIIK
jgi:hypothetical protein